MTIAGFTLSAWQHNIEVSRLLLTNKTLEGAYMLDLLTHYGLKLRALALPCVSSSLLYANKALAQLPSASSPADPALVQGVSTAGTVRSCNLANLEALLNIISNGVEIIAILAGTWLITRATLKPCSAKVRSQKIGVALAVIACGLFVPTAVNYFVSFARDVNLFS